MLQTEQKLLLKEPILDNSDELLIESNGYNFKCNFEILERKELDGIDIYETLENESFNVIQLDNIQFENFVVPLTKEVVYMHSSKRNYNKKYYFYKIELKNTTEINKNT